LDIFENISAHEPPFNLPKSEAFHNLTFCFIGPKSISVLNFLHLRFSSV
jgi:hypothetical protein